MSKNIEKIKSKIWNEIPEEDNPFAAAICYCNGFDVYGDLLGKISWSEYLYLLFQGDPPSQSQAKLLETIAIIIANPGLRDHSVRAAMNGGVGGSASASCLMAALAAGSGNLNGSREIYILINMWNECGRELHKWQTCMTRILSNDSSEDKASVWKFIEHAPGFDPYGVSCSTPVLQALNHLQDNIPSSSIQWLNENRIILEQITDCPLAMSGVIAAAMYDLGLTAEKAELLYLILRLPGAAVHSLEQKKYGWKQYPFFKDGLTLTNMPPNRK